MAELCFHFNLSLRFAFPFHASKKGWFFDFVLLFFPPLFPCKCCCCCWSCCCCASLSQCIDGTRCGSSRISSCPHAELIEAQKNSIFGMDSVTVSAALVLAVFDVSSTSLTPLLFNIVLDEWRRNCCSSCISELTTSSLTPSESMSLVMTPTRRTAWTGGGEVGEKEEE